MNKKRTWCRVMKGKYEHGGSFLHGIMRDLGGGMDASIRMIANHRGCAKNAHVQCYSSLFPDLNIHCLPTLAPARFPKIKESFMHIYEGMLTTTP